MLAQVCDMLSRCYVATQHKCHAYIASHHNPSHAYIEALAMCYWPMLDRHDSPRVSPWSSGPLMPGRPGGPALGPGARGWGRPPDVLFQFSAWALSPTFLHPRSLNPILLPLPLTPHIPTDSSHSPASRQLPAQGPSA